MTKYRFLIDNDSQSASRFFPAKRVVTLHRAGLEPNASDSDIVEKACDLECIIVTANGQHFEREIRKALLKTKKKSCHDLFGLVVIPNPSAVQERVLPSLTKKLQLAGKPISWDDVWYKNLLVRVHANGNVEVRELGRCFYCKKIAAKEDE
jgi:hypothetical protein